jgi:hypothetical protein
MDMLQRRTRWFAVGAVAIGLVLSGCADKSSESELKGPATLVERGEDQVPQIVLADDKAAERLGIEYVEIVDEAGAKVIPYSAVVYDSDGKTWAYTSPKSLTFERQPITVTNIEGDKATLSDGPASGTPVVTVGAAELLGVEAGIGY